MSEAVGRVQNLLTRLTRGAPETKGKPYRVGYHTGERTVWLPAYPSLQEARCQVEVANRVEAAHATATCGGGGGERNGVWWFYEEAPEVE
jgi:hypothetical protein